MEHYFSAFRKHIIGQNETMSTPYDDAMRIVYADWTASGRMYQPIEDRMLKMVLPFVANTHTETTISGTAMTMAYHEARHIIKHHVNANSHDILITDGTGMTGVVNKFQRELTGYRLQHLVVRRWQHERTARTPHALARERDRRGGASYRARDGARYPARCVLSAIPDRVRPVAGVLPPG